MTPPSSLKVLIVDDNRSAADAMARMLRRRGDDVEAVYDGQSAIDLLRTDPPEVVLTDLKMEPVDGFEVLKAARALRPPVEVIVFTAYGAVETAVDAMRFGARDFMTKPVTMEQIERRLEALRGDGQEDDETTDYATDFIASSSAAAELLDTLQRAAAVPANVWIEGEHGSGRGHAARTLHALSGSKEPFVVVDVARNDPWPDRGTVLLPAVDSLPLDLQATLHRSLDRLPQGVRVVATASGDGRRAITEGRLRPDLYYALAVVIVKVPPLRERVDDIVPLLRFSLNKLAERYRRQVPPVSAARAQRLERHRWPGNVRELVNMAERAVVMGPGALDFDALGAAAPGLPELEEGFKLADYLEGVEKRILVEALRKAGGDRNEAGRILGVERNSLRYKLKKYGLLE